MNANTLGVFLQVSNAVAEDRLYFAFDSAVDESSEVSRARLM